MIYLKEYFIITYCKHNALKPFILLGFMLLGLAVKAQRTAVHDTVPQGKIIEIIKADRYNRNVKDSNNIILSLGGNVVAKQDKTTIYADSIVLDVVKNILEAFGNVHINDADSIHTYAKYVKYLGKEKKAFLKNNVKLTDGVGTLTTNDLTYDVGIKMGTYTGGGKLVNAKTTITSTDGFYYGDVKDVYFKKKVVVLHPEYKIYTDTLLYNLNSEVVNFMAPTKIYNGKRIITTHKGYYNFKAKKTELITRSIIDDSSYVFTADKMAFEDSSGYGEFVGNAVYKTKDPKNGYDLIANNIKTNSKTGSFLASQKPLLFIRQDTDTTYVSGDSLYSAKYIKYDSTGKIKNTIPKQKTATKNITTINNNSNDSTALRFFEAYGNVKIFNDSMQAVSDSMFFNAVDSVFQLYKNPITWAKQNQLIGDTMWLYVKNRKPLMAKVWENATAISQVNKTYYNQMQGNYIDCFFKEGVIDSIVTQGSPAQNVYYAEDDYKKLVGVNANTCDVITIWFKDQKPEKVKFINNLTGTMYPINQANHKDLQVKGFSWQEAKRPKSKYDILGN